MVNGRPHGPMTCARHAELALELSEGLLALSSGDHGECERADCLLLDGIVRDCARAVRQAALERQRKLKPDGFSQRSQSR